MTGLIEPIVEPLIDNASEFVGDLLGNSKVLDIREDLLSEFSAPSPRQLFGEIKSIASAMTHGVQSSAKKFISGPKSFDGFEHVTLAFPGVGSPGWLLDPTVNYLNFVDPKPTAAFTWGRHINIGPTPFLYNFVDELIDKACHQSGAPITGVGHSLGSLFHLYFARLYPDKYDHVIGLGGPCELTLAEAHTKTNVGPAFTVMEKLSFLFHSELLTTWDRQCNLEAIPNVMRSMIIAANDGIVDPLSCLLPDQPGCRNFIFKRATHTSLVDDKDVLELVGLLRKYGNGPELDKHLTPNILARLTTPDKVLAFQKKPDPSVVEILRGTKNFIHDTTSETREKIITPVRAATSHLSNSVTNIRQRISTTSSTEPQVLTRDNFAFSDGIAI